MNEQTQKKKEIDTALELAVSSTTVSKATRLNAFNEICESLVMKAVPLKITLVVKFMIENGHQISQQSIYNKQDGGNPYRKLFDLWSEYDALKRSHSKPTVKVKQSQDSYIDDGDLKLIEDPALRYRISLMYGELKGLKRQNDLLKQIKEMNIIQSIPEYMIDSKNPSEITLNDYEINILKEFVASSSYISFNEDGALIASLPVRKGQSLSNQGLKDALLKILNSYNAYS